MVLGFAQSQNSGMQRLGVHGPKPCARLRHGFVKACCPLHVTVTGNSNYTCISPPTFMYNEYPAVSLTTARHSGRSGSSLDFSCLETRQSNRIVVHFGQEIDCCVLIVTRVCLHYHNTCHAAETSFRGGYMDKQMRLKLPSAQL